MRRKIAVSVFLAVAACTVRAAAQGTALKWNALYWAVGVPNMSVETRLGNRFTFNGDVVWSPWESVKGRPMKGVQVIPEVRFYPKQAFRGFYAGAYVSYDWYEVSKWDHPKTDVQHGYGTCIGLTLGGQIDIARRWGMDFYVGGGWHYGHYYGIDRTTGRHYADWNASGEWIPYKAGVTFVYRLGMGRKGE